MKTVFTKEAKIGLVSIVSLALLYIGINFLKGVNLFKPSNHYYVTFSNVTGVTVSSPVYVEGFKVGLVREINYDYNKTGKITVLVSLEDNMRINKGSYISILNTFLSGAELHIHLNRGAHGFRYDDLSARKFVAQRRKIIAKNRFDSWWVADLSESSCFGSVVGACGAYNFLFGALESSVGNAVS